MNLGGKTGTSSEHADGWYISVTTDIVTAAWTGNDDPSLHFRSGMTGEGSRTGLPIVGRFLQFVFKDPALPYPPEHFPAAPQGLKVKRELLHPVAPGHHTTTTDTTKTTPAPNRSIFDDHRDRHRPGPDRTHPQRVARLFTRVCTEAEREYYEKFGEGRFERYAGRFAAKEAISKALGTGIAAGVNWTDIEILPTPSALEARLHGAAAARMATLGATRVLVSITHDKVTASAVGILEVD